MHRLWRFASPSMLLFALLLFPLPWIEIQCDEFFGKPNLLRQAGVPAPVADVLYPAKQVNVYYRQSGWQVARGTYTVVPVDNLSAEEAVRRQRFERELSASLQGSWLLAAYPLVLLSGAGIGMAVPLSRRRTLLVAAFALLALALVGIQVIEEFPLQQAYRELPWEHIMSDAGAKRVAADEVEDMIHELIRFTSWFWLAHFFTLACLLLLVVEAWLRRRARRALDRRAIQSPQPVSA